MEQLELFEEDSQASEKEKLLASGELTAAVEKFFTLQSMKNSIEASLKLTNEKINELETLIIPEIMDRMNLGSFTTQRGDSVNIKSVIQASLPTKTALMKARGEERKALLERLNMALSWLREHDGASLIKNKVSVDIGKRDEIADELCKLIQDNYHLTPEREEAVHPATLTSFIKEKLNDGEEVPLDTFNVFMGRKAVLKIKGEK